MADSDGQYVIGSGPVSKCPYCKQDLPAPDDLDEKVSRYKIWRRHRRKHFDWANTNE